MSEKPQQHRVIRLLAVCDRLNVSRSSIYNWLDQKSKQYNPSFPIPIRIGKHTVGWIEAEIDGYIGALANQRQTTKR